MTDTTKQIASFDPGRVLQDQVAAWTKERDRLQQLIDTATGRAAPAAAPQGVNCDTPIGYRRDTTDPAEAANRMIAEVAAQGVEAPIPTSEVFAYAARKVEDELRQAREIMGVEAQKGGAA